MENRALILPSIINCDTYTDSRGSLIYSNEFDMQQVRRFYVIVHPQTETVRAWQGHMIEQKWFFVTEGLYKMYVVQPDNWHRPSTDLTPQSFILDSSNSQILHVPGGYVTGFKAITCNAKMIVYSNLALGESNNDDFRFPKSLWVKWE